MQRCAEVNLQGRSEIAVATSCRFASASWICREAGISMTADVYERLPPGGSSHLADSILC